MRRSTWFPPIFSLRDWERAALTQQDNWKAVIDRLSKWGGRLVVDNIIIHPGRWNELVCALDANIKQRTRGRACEVWVWMRRCMLVDLPHTCLVDLVDTAISRRCRIHLTLSELSATHTVDNEVVGGPATTLTQLRTLFQHLRERNGAVFDRLEIHAHETELHTLLCIARPALSSWIQIYDLVLGAPNHACAGLQQLRALISDSARLRDPPSLVIYAEGTCDAEKEYLRRMFRLIRESRRVQLIAMSGTPNGLDRVIKGTLGRHRVPTAARDRRDKGDRVWAEPKDNDNRDWQRRWYFVKQTRIPERVTVDVGCPSDDMEATCARITKTYPLAQCIVIGSPRTRWQQHWADRDDQESSAVRRQ
jgi:hypothetical protein